MRKMKGPLLSDSIVDGVLHGMFAGLFMLAFFIVMGGISGHKPLDLLSMLVVPGTAATPGQGALVHLAISAFYGIVWCTLIVLPLRRWMPQHAIGWRLAGIAFGMVTWLAALIAIMNWGTLSLLPPYAVLIAHLGYGGTLGYLQVRRDSTR